MVHVLFSHCQTEAKLVILLLVIYLQDTIFENIKKRLYWDIEVKSMRESGGSGGACLSRYTHLRRKKKIETHIESLF